VFTTLENASSYSIQNEQVTCTCKRLDGLPIEGDSMVMKIDVEGQEWEVLSGSSVFFEANRVKAVYVDGYKDSNVREFLRGYGFEFLNGRTLEAADQMTRHLLAIKTTP